MMYSAKVTTMVHPAGNPTAGGHFSPGKIIEQETGGKWGYTSG